MEENALQKTPAAPTAVFQPSGTSVGGELDIQIVTAKRYPRSLQAYEEKAMGMATLSREVAEQCFYTLPRSNKAIFGKSIRLAEIVANAYGNLVVSGRVTDVDDRWVYAEGAAWDLENNVRILKTIRRRITNKFGERYNDDMIGVTSQAAVSIACRNAIFFAVPMALTEGIYQAALRAAAGDEKTLAERRGRAYKYFIDKGVTKTRLMTALGKPNGGEADIGIEQLLLLQGFKNAINDGELSLETAFPDTAPEGKSMAEGKQGFGKNGKAKKPAKKAKPKVEVEPEPVVEPTSITLEEAEAPPAEVEPEPVVEPEPEPEPEVDPDAEAIEAIRQEYIKDDFDVPDEAGLRMILKHRQKARPDKKPEPSAPKKSTGLSDNM